MTKDEEWGVLPRVLGGEWRTAECNLFYAAQPPGTSNPNTDPSSQKLNRLSQLNFL